MHYILCEDEKSGKIFFENISSIFKNVSCDIRSTKGNTNYNNYLNSILKMLKRGDSLLLAFDNIGSKKGFNPSEIILKAKTACLGVGAKLWVTKYYCFEELYLSYTEFINMCEHFSKNSKRLEELLPTLKYVNSCILEQKEYFDRNNPLVDCVIKMFDKAGGNKENFCSTLLENSTRELKGIVTIKKNSFGICWLHSCSDLRFKNKDYICNNLCIFAMKNSDGLSKLFDLENNSMCTLYTPFSVFFN